MKILLAAAFALTAVATSAQAQTAPTSKVFYGDLRLDTAAGQTTLKSRVDTAARRVCDSSSHQDLATRTAAIRCFHDAVTTAMAQVSEPTVQVASR